MFTSWFHLNYALYTFLNVVHFFLIIKGQLIYEIFLFFINVDKKMMIVVCSNVDKTLQNHQY